MSKKIKILSGWNAFRLVLGVLLLVFYLVVAFLFLFTDKWIDLIPDYRTLIGITILSFAAFRFYVSFYRYKTKRIKLQTKLTSSTAKSQEEVVEK